MSEAKLKESCEKRDTEDDSMMLIKQKDESESDEKMSDDETSEE